MLLRYTITLCHYITLPPLINNSTRAVKRHESKMKDSVVPPELRRNPVPRGHHHALLHGLTRALARQPEPVSKPMPGPAKRLLPCVPPARAGQVRGKKRVVTRPHAAAPRPAPASRRHAQPGRVRRCSGLVAGLPSRQALLRHPRRLLPREGHGAPGPGQHSSQLHAIVVVEKPEARAAPLLQGTRATTWQPQTVHATGPATPQTFYSSRAHRRSG
jgi:hypothetical protein